LLIVSRAIALRLQFPSPSSSPLRGEEIDYVSSPFGGEGWGEGVAANYSNTQAMKIRNIIGTIPKAIPKEPVVPFTKPAPRNPE